MVDTRNNNGTFCNYRNFFSSWRAQCVTHTNKIVRFTRIKNEIRQAIIQVKYTEYPHDTVS